jgi:hypothetical protein
LLSKQWIKHKEIQDLFVEMNERIMSFATKEYSGNKALVEDFLNNFQKDSVQKKEGFRSPKGGFKTSFFSAKKAMKKEEVKVETSPNKKKTHSTSLEKYNCYRYI